MKKALMILMCLLLIVPVSLAQTAVPEKPVIVVSSYPLLIAVQHIAGDYAEIICLNPEGKADYSPDDQALVLIESSALVIVLGTEAWLADIAAEDKVAAVMNGLRLLDAQGNPYAEGAEADEYFWLAPINLALAGYEVEDALSLTDPEHAKLFAANAEAFTLEMIALDNELREALSESKGQEIRGENGCSVAYFAAEYGLVYAPMNADAVALDVIHAAGEYDYAARMLDNAQRLK